MGQWELDFRADSAERSSIVSGWIDKGYVVD